jgi:hypothetical protein
MKISYIYKKLLSEQSILNTTRTKPIVNAIKNRNPITFYYSGPRKPKKNSVKPGTRIEAEVVALGLSKKGNLVIRAWVQPPSVSKKGFKEHGWRTFMVTRMSNIQILTNKTFDETRPKYNPGDDGSMTVTYVTSEWDRRPKNITPKEKPEPTTGITPIQPEPTVPEPTVTEPIEPEIENQPEELPQIKPKKKISAEPELTTKTDFSSQVFDGLKNKINDVDGRKTLSNLDYESSLIDLSKRKEGEWIDVQKKIGGNVTPGQGTRERFKKESKSELDGLLQNNNVEVVNNQLQENIIRIKSLM